MKIISVNAGSSSLKFKLFNMPEEKVLTEGVVERIGLKDSIFTIKFNGQTKKEILNVSTHEKAVSMLLNKLVDYNIVETLEEIEGIGHRVVHGGETFKDSVLINQNVMDEIERLSDLAPLHNPANLTGIKAFQRALPNVKAVAVFDTAFHQTMEPVAYMYSVPYHWYEKYGVRKYGFHGTSHKYVSHRAAEILNKPIEKTKVIVCHIGNGVSLCAVKGGKSIDTSMGFTPLAGVSMGTRSGDIDPAIIQFIAQKEKKNINEIMNELNKNSGYLGMSQLSSDSRDLWEAVDRGDKKSILAVEKQAKMIADYIGAYYLALGGCDAICFTAGIGENASETRKLVVNRLGALGIELDYEKNLVRGKEAIISKEKSNVKVLLIPTNEEVMIARDVYRLI